MSHFPLISETDIQDSLAAQVYAEIRKELGFGIVPNIFKSMAIRPTLLRANWDHCLKIPILNPKVRSLNLANSVAIVLYEALRQTETIR